MKTNIRPRRAELELFFSGEVEMYASQLRRPVSRWQGVFVAVNNLFGRFASRVCLRKPNRARRDELLLDAAVALRSGRPMDAAKILDPFYRVLLSDPQYLNLVAATSECNGDRFTAMRLYHICLELDSEYRPARANLYRCAAEKTDAGCSIRSIMLGDNEIRAQRAVPMA